MNFKLIGRCKVVFYCSQIVKNRIGKLTQEGGKKKTTKIKHDEV